METVKNNNDKETGFIDLNEFQAHIAETYGISEDSPAGRIDQLKQLSVEGAAMLLEDINKTVNNSNDSLVSDSVIMIGNKPTLDVEHRHQVFEQLIHDIRESDSLVSPERVGDVLALGVVLLHPFKDGNGRTARVIGMMFRDDYTGPDAQDSFSTVTESRDRLREKGGWMINGYIPKTDADMSDPTQVSIYLRGLLHEEMPGSYVSCFGEAPLEKMHNNESSLEQQGLTPIEMIYANYSNYAKEVAQSRQQKNEAIGNGQHSSVSVIEKDGKKYAVRIVDKHFHEGVDVANDHVEASALVRDMPRMEKIVAASKEEGVTIAELLTGKHIYDIDPEVIELIPDEHLDALLENRIEAVSRGVQFDIHPGNIMYDPNIGFTDIDFHIATESSKQPHDRISSMVSVLASLECVGKVIYEHDKKIADGYEKSGLAVRRRMIKYIESHFSNEDYINIRERWVVQISMTKAAKKTFADANTQSD
ncbi:Fic family protein [Candidatus Saccharibacteria bacterium]|nr:Fic family protein [Candidatus Saccharibacteria bacterium]